MLLGSKPLAEMTEIELLTAIRELRGSREELRKESIAKKREAKQLKVKAQQGIVTAEMLAFLRGETDEIE